MIEGQEGVSWEDWLALAKACEAHASRRCSAPTTTSTWTASIPSAARSTLGHDQRAGRRHHDAAARHARLARDVPPSSELAKIVATADHVSGGRVELGLGAGWHEPEHRAYGFPFPALRDRMDRLAEQLEIVHGTWTSAALSSRARYYAARGPGRTAAAGPGAASAAADGRGGRAARRRAGGALGGRVQHAVRVARAGALAQGGDRRGVRGSRSRADPVLADDGLPGGAEPRGAAREAAPRSPHAMGEPERDVDAWLATPPGQWIVARRRGRRSGVAAPRRGLARVMLGSTCCTPTS